MAGIVVPCENASEAAPVGGIEVYPADALSTVVAHLNDHHKIDPHPPLDVEGQLANESPEVDFADVRGQEAAKRAVTLAAAGGHNILMIGPAGTGETVIIYQDRTNDPTAPPHGPESRIWAHSGSGWTTRWAGYRPRRLRR